MPSKVEKQNAVKATKSSDLVKIKVRLPSLFCSKSALMEILKHSESLVLDHSNSLILDVPSSKKQDIWQTMQNLTFEGRKLNVSPFSQDKCDSLRRQLIINQVSDINLQHLCQHFGASEVQHEYKGLFTLTFKTIKAAEQADDKLLSMDGRTFWLSPLPPLRNKRKAEGNESSEKPSKQMKKAHKKDNERRAENDEEEDDENDEEEFDAEEVEEEEEEVDAEEVEGEDEDDDDEEGEEDDIEDED